MTLHELYRQYQSGAENGAARELLRQAHWFASLVERNLDPKTGEALPQALSSVLHRIARLPKGSEPQLVLKDRLWRITEHARPSLERLFRELNESPRRENAILPLRSVRELDTSSFMALARRPGRTIREKLASKPYLQAVRHFQTIDLPENSLLKAFSERLAELLELRAECFGTPPDGLLFSIRSWLAADEVKDIRRWENLPPNNTLLTHRDYRAVYDAWTWLQTIDDDVTKDLGCLELRRATMQKWNDYGRTYAECIQHFAEVPVFFDYDNFGIKPWTGAPVFEKLKARPVRPKNLRKTMTPVCVDLSELYPCCARVVQEKGAERSSESCVYPLPLIWQRWSQKGDSGAVKIDLFHADAAFIGADVSTVAARDLFFAHDISDEDLRGAAFTFAAKLRETFQGDSLIWLVPDSANDFQLEAVRQGINASFPGAVPLPRSVAAVMERVDYARLKDGFPILVVDWIGNRKCAIKLVARHDDGLRLRVPATHGFYWERHPPVVLSMDVVDEKAHRRAEYPIVTVDNLGKWHALPRTQVIGLQDERLLRKDPRIGDFAFLVTIPKSPVKGGIRLHMLQEQAGNIPLWRDLIPELSMKAFVDGRYRRFCLVTRSNAKRDNEIVKGINPTRGKVTPIDVEESFVLPAGKRRYQLPLFVGENEDELGYSAVLESPSFPLAGDLTCDLSMTFTYGVDQPYCLIFKPRDKSIAPIRVKWSKTKEDVVTDAPAPAYPHPMTWEELRHWKDAQGNDTDLLHWIIESLRNWEGKIPEKCRVQLTQPWKRKQDEKGRAYWYTFAQTTDQRECYCNTGNFVSGKVESPNDAFPKESYLYCFIRKTQRGLSALSISVNEDDVVVSNETKCILARYRERSLQNRISFAFSDGRSLRDADCPEEFKQDFEKVFSSVVEKLPKDLLGGRMRFLQACLHKDAPDECVKWIYRQIERGRISDKRAVGFALGDVAECWQKDIMNEMCRRMDDDALRVFAYAIWRDERFVEKFSSVECKSILRRLVEMLKSIRPCPARKPKDEKYAVRDWIRAVAEPLELLLGMLRTRASANDDIRMLLQPHQKITKELARQVEKVAEIIADSNKVLYSRVQLVNLPPKQEGDRTPDLLYALRLYLTNDVGANAIRITGISDSDEDDNGGNLDAVKSTRDNRKGRPSAETIGLFHIKEC